MYVGMVRILLQLPTDKNKIVFICFPKKNIKSNFFSIKLVQGFYSQNFRFMLCICTFMII